MAILGTAPLPDAPWWKRLSPSTIYVLLAGAIAVLFLLHELTISKKLGYPLDESWVEQVYARNFFHHIAFEYNPGERTAGPTAPLWTVFLAIATGIFHDPILAGKLLGAIFLFLTGYYAFRLLRSSDHDYGSSLLGGVLVMTCGALAWSELSGLESALSAALVTGGLWWYFENLPRTIGHAGWQRHLTGAIFALAALSRPETGLVFAILLIYQLWHGVRAWRQGQRSEHFAREAFFSLLVFVLILGPIALTNIAISGAVVPETFYAGIGRESVIVLGRHGNFGEILLRLAQSWRSIGYAACAVYAPANPLLLCTIIVALPARYRAKWLKRDHSDNLYDLTLLILIAFPYLRATMLGVDDNFGEQARWMHFLLPVFILCGLTSLRILVRCFYRRPLGAKPMLVYSCIALLLAGSLVLFALPPAYMVESALTGLSILVLFVLVLGFTAMRYAGLSATKVEDADVVTEESRTKMTFIAETDDFESLLPEKMTLLLRAMLLIALAWNIALLPQVAEDFAMETREINQVNLGMAKFIGWSTAPSDVIATDAIGAIGWFSDRKLIDVQGRLTNEPSYNARQLGPERGMLKTLIDSRPTYYASLGVRYDSIVNDAVRSHFFALMPSTAKGQRYQLYKLDYSVLPQFAAKWDVR